MRKESTITYPNDMARNIKIIKSLPDKNVQFYSNFVIINGECFNGITKEIYAKIRDGKI